MWPFKKNISEPVQSIVKAILNNEFRVSYESAGEVSIVHSDVAEGLTFWGGRLCDAGWATEDEKDAIVKAYMTFRKTQRSIKEAATRNSFMKLVKEKR